LKLFRFLSKKRKLKTWDPGLSAVTLKVIDNYVGVVERNLQRLAQPLLGDKIIGFERDASAKRSKRFEEVHGVVISDTADALGYAISRYLANQKDMIDDLEGDRDHGVNPDLLESIQYQKKVIKENSEKIERLYSSIKSGREKMDLRKHYSKRDVKNLFKKKDYLVKILKRVMEVKEEMDKEITIASHWHDIIDLEKVIQVYPPKEGLVWFFSTFKHPVKLGTIINQIRKEKKPERWLNFILRELDNMDKNMPFGSRRIPDFFQADDGIYNVKNAKKIKGDE
jgi:hypothetical protein